MSPKINIIDLAIGAIRATNRAAKRRPLTYRATASLAAGVAMVSPTIIGPTTAEFYEETCYEYAADFELVEHAHCFYIIGTTGTIVVSGDGAIWQQHDASDEGADLRLWDN